MKGLLKAVGTIVVLLGAGSFTLGWLGAINSVVLGFFLIAISIVFVAVFSKAYRNWPT